MNKYAYVTLATTPSFLKGAHFLDYSLKRVKSKYPLIIMVTENLKEYLTEDCNYRIIPYYKFTNPEPRYVDTVNKLQCFTLTEYDKVFFIDADILVTENVDCIFDEIQEEFYSGIRPHPTMGKTFCGDRAIYIPQTGKFESILENKDFMSFPHDEAVLYYLYQHIIDRYDSLDFIYADRFLHLSGEKKYWEVVDVSVAMFETMTMEEIKQYFAGW